jgi:hypothetical protein
VTLADPACQVRGGMFPSQRAPRLDPAPRIVIGRGASEEGEMYCKSRGSSHVWTVKGGPLGRELVLGAGLVCGADGRGLRSESE